MIEVRCWDKIMLDPYIFFTKQLDVTTSHNTAKIRRVLGESLSSSLFTFKGGDNFYLALHISLVIGNWNNELKGMCRLIQIKRNSKYYVSFW